MSERIVVRGREPVATQQRGARATSFDPIGEAIHRLRWIALAMSFLPLLPVLVTTQVAPPGSPHHDARGMLIALVAAGGAISFGVYTVLGRTRIPSDVRLDVGFAYQVVVAFLAAVVRHLVPWTPGDGFREVSPVAVVILVFAALIPNPPRRTFFASLLAAMMDPVGLLISVARGNPMPPVVQTMALVASPLIATVLATVISRVNHGLARGVDEARRMGSYRLTTRLGSGGMGEVWHAEHRLLARPAAIKLVRPDAAGDAAALKRFEREAVATSELKSPHTIHLYDFGVTDDGTFYYVMELLDGLDLESFVKKYGAMSPARAVWVLRQMCDSLDEAHEAGLVHRDIKPANVYLCRYGRKHDFVKVLDFGLVKPNRKGTDASAATLTMEGALAGTPAFIAPEAVLGEKPVDARADLYAVGCVAYWLLTGKLVFEGDSAMKIVLSHVQTEPPPPSQRTDAKIPAALERIVLDCLEKDPERRPPSAAHLGRRLSDVDVEGAWDERIALQWWEEHLPRGAASSGEVVSTGDTVAA
jgi:eukaryotic-like serine/threonine-protein kinase